MPPLKIYYFIIQSDENRKSIMKKACCFLFIITVCTSAFSASKLVAQANKTFWYGIQLRGAVSGGNVLPFWLYANRHGTVDPYSPGASVTLNFHKRLTSDDKFDYGFGATLIGRYSKFENLSFNQLYGAISYGALKLTGGRFYEHTGTVFAPLSMGSLTISPNATPLPKIKLGIFNYAPVPFTNGFVEIKGAIARAWFGEERRFENALLHEKYVYFRVGGDFAFRPYIGLVHQAVWAGKTDSGFEAPDTFNDFLRIFAALKGDSTALPSGRVYALGDHRGIWDIGFYLTIADIDFTVYRQFIYDDKDGLEFDRFRDGLLGVSIELPGTEQHLITAFLWEYLNTKWQGGPACPGSGRGGPGGCENYYNNSVYRTGWQYLGRTLGNPLFLTVNAPGIEMPARKFGITNNRIIAHHFGLMGRLSPSINYKLLATWSRNYGVYPRLYHQVPNEFQAAPEQWSFLTKFSYQPAGFNAIRFNLSLAADAGELYEDTFGVLFGVQLIGTSPF